MRNFSQYPKIAGRWPLAASSLALVLLTSCGGGGAASTAPNEVINGIAVPPAPANSTASVAGTDVNANGIRDDLERVLATRLGSNVPTYNKAILVAAKVQTALTNSGASADALAQVFSESTCSDIALVDLVLDEAVNNKERYEKFIEAYVAMVEAKIASDTENSLLTTNCR